MASSTTHVASDSVGVLRPVERRQHRPQVLPPDERHVAVEDEDALGLRPHRREPHARGVPRPALLLLDRRSHLAAGRPRERPREVLLDRLPPVAHDDDDLGAPGVERRLYAEVHDRKSGDGVHHLGEGALHARPLPRGEDDGGRADRANGGAHLSPVWLSAPI